MSGVVMPDWKSMVDPPKPDGRLTNPDKIADDLARKWTNLANESAGNPFTADVGAFCALPLHLESVDGAPKTFIGRVTMMTETEVVVNWLGKLSEPKATPCWLVGFGIQKMLRVVAAASMLRRGRLQRHLWRFNAGAERVGLGRYMLDPLSELSLSAERCYALVNRFPSLMAAFASVSGAVQADYPDLPKDAVESALRDAYTCGVLSQLIGLSEVSPGANLVS